MHPKVENWKEDCRDLQLETFPSRKSFMRFTWNLPQFSLIHFESSTCNTDVWTIARLTYWWGFHRLEEILLNILKTRKAWISAGIFIFIHWGPHGAGLSCRTYLEKVASRSGLCSELMWLGHFTTGHGSNYEDIPFLMSKGDFMLTKFCYKQKQDIPAFLLIWRIWSNN